MYNSVIIQYFHGVTMAKDELRRLESALQTGPNLETAKEDSGTARFLVSAASKGLSQYYNSHMENSNKLYNEKISQEARYAKSGEDFIKRVDEVITPQYKSKMLFSQAHGQTAARVPLMAREIDLINDKKLNDLNTSNFLNQVSQLSNKSIDYESFASQAQKMLGDYTKTNGDLDAIGTKNYENILNTAQTSFEMERKNKSVTTYLNNAITAFGVDTDKHYKLDNFIDFIEKDIGKNVGGSPTLMREALNGVMQFVPNMNIANELVSRYSGSLSGPEQDRLKAIASTGIERSRYQAQKELANLKGRIQEGLNIGLATTDPDLVGILSQEQRALNNFALQQNLAQKSPDDLHLMYSELNTLHANTVKQLKESISEGLKAYDTREQLIEAQNWFSKLVQGKEEFTEKELAAKAALDQINEIEDRQSYLKQMSDKFYRDFSKDFVEAITARNPNVSVQPLTIPLVDDRGVVYGKDEFLQSMINRKTLFDYYSTAYQDSEALNNPYSAEEITKLNEVFNKVDVDTKIELADGIRKTWGDTYGYEHTRNFIIKASGDLALAQSIMMTNIEGNVAAAPTMDIYRAYDRLKKEKPDKLNEWSNQIDGYLSNIPALDTAYMDPDLKSKLKWMATGKTVLEDNGDINSALDNMITVHQKRYSLSPSVTAEMGATYDPASRRIGAYFLSKDDFLNFRKQIEAPEHYLDNLKPNTVWVNNGDSTKSFVLMEYGEDGILRPYYSERYATERIRWRNMFRYSSESEELAPDTSMRLGGIAKPVREPKVIELP